MEDWRRIINTPHTQHPMEREAYVAKKKKNDAALHYHSLITNHIFQILLFFTFPADIFNLRHYRKSLSSTTTPFQYSLLRAFFPLSPLDFFFFFQEMRCSPPPKPPAMCLFTAQGFNHAPSFQSTRLRWFCYPPPIGQFSGQFASPHVFVECHRANHTRELDRRRLKDGF
ncbi:uncharacterized protein BDZ99DRAFT_262216 [Mytilinidion resinicola]|uniref:Uncharacterized protein n=1 Tax=Mytilinidion resinicola TaxID=574789 RepID=A0A6A6YT57_9PEZI|nr:uncharacterized protein BDZ99DRAFT_262216 [Mytilinidion resinicola]KAF2812136.1 hypothetical protein BDZ99DRAFT_262216 [Mytilinidion resinicola]